MGDRDETHPGFVEYLHQFCEVQQAPGQPIDLVDNDIVDKARGDVGQQSLEARPF